MIFAGRAQAPEAVAEPLAVARDVAAALGERRGTTSLDIESFEPEFRFDSAGNVIGAKAMPQTEAHRLIERLMILANEQVAQLLERKRVAAIYRVHAQPDPPADREADRAAPLPRGADSATADGDLAP